MTLRGQCLCSGSSFSFQVPMCVPVLHMYLNLLITLKMDQHSLLKVLKMSTGPHSFGAVRTYISCSCDIDIQTIFYIMALHTVENSAHLSVK